MWNIASFFVASLYFYIDHQLISLLGILADREGEANMVWGRCELRAGSLGRTGRCHGPGKYIPADGGGYVESDIADLVVGSLILVLVDLCSLCDRETQFVGSVNTSVIEASGKSIRLFNAVLE